MGSPFDNLQNAVFDTTTQVMGYDCSWTAVDGGASSVCRVHFGNPTEGLRLAGVAYEPDAIEMEYKEGDLAGLKERADLRSTQERVTIGGQDFFVLSVSKKHDGKTYLARLKKVVE